MHKTFVQFFITVLLLLLVSMATLNYLTDPLQYYSRDKSKALYTKARWQVPGFIYNFDYDYIIMGTSMAENFSIPQIRAQFQVNPIKLALPGTKAQEQTLALEMALQRRQVNTVIWEIEPRYLEYQPGKWPLSFPHDLYRRNWRGHLLYLLGHHTLQESAKSLTKDQHSAKHKKLADIDLYNNWHDHFQYSKQSVLDTYTPTAADDSIIRANIDNISTWGLALGNGVVDLNSLHLANNKIKQELHTNLTNLDRDVVGLIKAHPDVVFIIVLPPCSLVYYKQLALDSEKFTRHLLLRQQLFAKLSQLSNVEVYDFETDLGVICDLGHYRDLLHYSGDINDHMIAKIANKRNLVRPQDIMRAQALFLEVPAQSWL